MNPARHQRICAEIQEAHQKEIEKMTAELEATKKAVQQNYFRVVEVTVERDALRAEAGDLTVQQRNSYQKGHNAGVAHHKEATKALRPAHDDTALLREALEWFDAMRVGAMSRNNAEQLADEVSAALRERLGEKV